MEGDGGQANSLRMAQFADSRAAEQSFKVDGAEDLRSAYPLGRRRDLVRLLSITLNSNERRPCCARSPPAARPRFKSSRMAAARVGMWYSKRNSSSMRSS